MAPLTLHPFHLSRGAVFTGLNGLEAVTHYGNPAREYHFLTASAALVDLSWRSRLCVLGADREKFLHGQVTNDVLRLKTGEGCYAALVNAKGRIQTDLFIYKLREELLLDFEPGLTEKVSERLLHYIIAEDVQVVDVAPHYGLLSVQGPHSADVLASAGIDAIPAQKLNWTAFGESGEEVYCTRNDRFGSSGYDLFVPTALIESFAEKLSGPAEAHGGGWAGFNACETVRIENAIPRFGMDMTENNLAPEAGIQDRAISYAKGCYIGQEVIARIRTYGQVAKALRLLRLEKEAALPAPGAKLLRDDREAGYITSSAWSPRWQANVALGYVRKEVNAPGEKLRLENGSGAEVIALPGNL